MQSNGSINKILNFWFGHVEETIVPSENRARIWFADSSDVDDNIKTQFKKTLQAAINGTYLDWEKEARGRLALIILLDQFSRHVYRDTPQAYTQDEKALNICIAGIHNENDHELSLIERVFFYFPLLHSEQLAYQEQSIRAYHMLAELAFAETRIIYDSFLKFANHHYTLIQRFGRFPQRNKILERHSTPEEIAYLKEIENEPGGNES